MNSVPVNFPEVFVSMRSGPRTRRAIADLVRSIVNVRKGISRISVVEWVTQFITNGDSSDVVSTVENVIDVLCSVNDIGFGVVRDEPVLVALPERRVALPDGRIIVLGNHEVGFSEECDLLFPEAETGATETLIDLLREFAAEDTQGLSDVSTYGTDLKFP